MTLRDQLHAIAVQLDAAPQHARESAARWLADHLARLTPEQREHYPVASVLDGAREGWLTAEIRDVVARLVRIVVDMDARSAA